MSDESSTSSDSTEVAIRTAFVYVPAFSRLRSISGNFFTPTGFGRVQSDSSTHTAPGPSPETTVTADVSSGGSGPNPNNKYVRTVLVLNSKCLYYEAQGWKREVLLEDLIGVQIEANSLSDNPNACELTVHYYPILCSRSGKKQGRKQLMMSVQFSSESTREENVQMAEEWKKLILLETQRVIQREFCGAKKVRATEDAEDILERKFLVLINPVGGQGKGVGDFEKFVKPLFDLAEIKTDIIITERQNHGREIAKEYDFSTVDGIVICSGDGLLFEVVNGIMEREDWETAIKTPVGMIPTGSGNGVCASALYESEEDFGLLNGVFQIIRGGFVPLDISTVELSEGRKCYMSLITAWGMVADIDIESEKFRKIGQPRFLLGALNCVRKKRLYSGKLSYLPIDENKSAIESTSNNTSSNEQNDNLPESPDQETLECIEGSTDIGKAIEGTRKNTTIPTDPAPITASSLLDPVADSAPANSAESATSFVPGELIVTKGLYGPKTDILPPLSSPVPSHWKIIDQEFVCLAGMSIPHMNSDTLGDPNLSIGANKYSIMYVDPSMGRIDLLLMFKRTEDGSYLGMDGCNLISAKAFRLEPKTPDGLLTIDGEVIPYGSMQAQLHPGLGRVMSRKRNKKI